MTREGDAGVDGRHRRVFNALPVDLDAIVACMERDGWAVDRLGETSARAVLRCGTATLPLFVWTEEGFAVFAVVPFVRIEREVEDCKELFELLLRLNQRINLARFGVDPDGDVALSVEWRRENIDPSEVRDALDVLAFYAREHREQVAALAGPRPEA
jgi:hypothetical protein